MKRIKLFEAFNITNKIEKVNSSVFCWCFESFIKSKIQDGSFEFIIYKSKYFIISDANSGNHLLIYDFNHNSIPSWSMHSVHYKSYFLSKNILFPYFLSDCQDEVLFVLKKLYQDEKNKTI